MEEPKVIKTIRNKNIPDDVKEKAIEEACLIAEQKLAHFEDDESISCFAEWKQTPSGQQFWQDIADAEKDA